MELILQPLLEGFSFAFLTPFVLFSRGSLGSGTGCPPSEWASKGELVGELVLRLPSLPSGALHHLHSASPSPTPGSSRGFSVHPPLSSPLFSPAIMPRIQLLLPSTGNSGQPSKSPGDVAPQGIWGQGCS